MKNLVMFALVASIGCVPFVNAADNTKKEQSGHAEKIVGDAEKGKAVSTQCAACHGADGNSTNPEWPKLAGQNESYLVKQLMAYRTGKRDNAAMTSMAKAIKSDEDVLHLAAYFSSQTSKPNGAKESLVKEGEAIYRGGIVEAGVAACSACHGPNGAGNPAAKFPSVAGQHAKYSMMQLEAFKEGKRNNDSGKMMRNLAKKMSKQQMEAVSEYMAGLKR